MKKLSQKLLKRFKKTYFYHWNEGLSNEEFNKVKHVLKYHYDNGSVYYWKEADSYFFPLLYGAFIVSKSYYHNNQ